MHYIVANVVPILAATVVGLLIGAAYRAALVRAGPDGGGLHPAWLLLIAVLSEFWLAAILAGALIVAPVQVGAWTIAIGSAIVIWIGFVVPTLVVSYAARRQRWSALLLDILHWLVVMVAQAAVLNFVGLARP